MRKSRIGYLRILMTVWMICFVFLAAGVSSEAAAFSKKAPVLHAKLRGNTVTLSWEKRSDLSGYQIYRSSSASGSGKRLLKTVKGTATSCIRTGLGRGKTYYYCVRGFKKEKKKTKYTSFSKVVRVQVPAAESKTKTSKSTLKKFLQTAMKPVGSTMYVWGGGWNKEDTGAGKEARTIGVSPAWERFFQKQKSDYDYRNTRYQISNGLDCSGYVGWCVYNILNTRSGEKGYVMLAQKMAKTYASYGWGNYIAKGSVRDYRAGDIMSSACSDCGHVWIVVGQCKDGSVVIAHASPPGVQLCGTPSKKGKSESEAVKLARKYMKKHFPKWYKKYPNCSRGSAYLSHYAQMRWDITGTKVMSDPEGYRNKSAEEILRDLFGD